ncbi:MAG TPA: elongation factor G, partial [Xanthobacteraceae bacterium]|nr:elongation factor G [Xanthobacteraceae bacterium]
FVYKEHAPSEVIPLEGDALDREKTARFSMLETLADHDDELMEQLLEDIQPPRDKVFDDLSKELREGLVCPVLLGSATRTNGVLRLMKALRHETPGIADTAKRLGVKSGQSVAYVLKTINTAHGGKMSVVRVLAGKIGDGANITTADGQTGRVAAVFKLMGQNSEKRGAAEAGETVAFGKLDHTKTGDTLSDGAQPHPAVAKVVPHPPVLSIAVATKERKDDVKLGQALAKLLEEDPSISVVHNSEAHEVVLWGQGEMQLRVATERLADRFGIATVSHKPTVGYRETIKKGIVQRGRHKKQSGGHGQYGDVVLDIKPLPRGSGFSFSEEIKGGVVPRNYIPSVEAGVIDALKHGPLGFPVVDVAAKLIDGSYHTVDSSDMAFRTAGRIGVHDALPQCQPVLLEPIYQVEIVCPSEATAKMNALMSGRRGQILGFDTREGWEGWDVVRVQMPESEIGDLIVEVRSATAGVGSFTFKFDHMAELMGRTAEQIVAARKAAAAA